MAGGLFKITAEAVGEPGQPVQISDIVFKLVFLLFGHSGDYYKGWGGEIEGKIDTKLENYDLLFFMQQG